MRGRNHRGLRNSLTLEGYWFVSWSVKKGHQHCFKMTPPILFHFLIIEINWHLTLYYLRYSISSFPLQQVLRQHACFGSLCRKLFGSSVSFYDDLFLWPFRHETELLKHPAGPCNSTTEPLSCLPCKSRALVPGASTEHLLGPFPLGCTWQHIG